jgi:hypothetical protein
MSANDWMALVAGIIVGVLPGIVVLIRWRKS